MSGANIETLAGLLRKAACEMPVFDRGDSTYGLLAEWLVARGVLCVDALTDEQCEMIWNESSLFEQYDGAFFESGDKMRASLLQAAQGTPGRRSA